MTAQQQKVQAVVVVGRGWVRERKFSSLTAYRSPVSCPMPGNDKILMTEHRRSTFPQRGRCISVQACDQEEDAVNHRLGRIVGVP